MKEEFATQSAVTLDQRIDAAINDAHLASEQYGAASSQSQVAWDIVEELQAEASHQRTRSHHTAFDDYCEEFPDALEARIYDI